MLKRIKTTQINLYNCDSPIMCSVEEAENFLSELVKEIGMNLIPEEITNCKNPKAFDFETSKVNLSEEEAGITGVVTLYESHIAIHTWTKTKPCNAAIVVISSCKDYDHGKTANWIVNKLKADIYKVKFIEM